MADGTYAGPYGGNGARNGDPVPLPPPPLLQELDAIEPRLSYQGWQKAVAESEERNIEGGMPAPWNDSVLQNNLRPGAVRVVSTTITLSIAELLCL